MAGVAVIAVVFAAIAWAERAGVWWWTSQTIECSLYFFPRFAWVAGAATLIALIASAVDRRVWRLRSLWMLSPIAVPVLLLAFGIAFRHTTFDPAPEWPRHVVEWFLWLLLPLALTLLACFRSVSNWLIILGLSIAAIWLSYGAGMMSWMSVTNIWL
ncbi:MAG: hypothetical protein ACP5XB_17585 [Isosphaeraceae bacterium]